MKKFLAIIMAGAMVLSMAGCSGGNSSANSADSDSQQTSAADSSADNSNSADTADSTVSTADSSASDASDSSALPVAMKPDLLSAAIQDKLGLDQQTADKAAEDMLPLLMYTQGNPARIAKVIKKLQAGEEVTIAYLGGSITQGTGADNENCYAALTTKWIENQFTAATPRC